MMEQRSCDLKYEAEGQVVEIKGLTEKEYDYLYEKCLQEGKEVLQ